MPQLTRNFADLEVRNHDIVMTITGFPGTACCIQEDDLPLNMNQHSVRFRLTEEWNPFFVAVFLNSDWGKAQIMKRSIGATRDALDYPSVLSLLVPNVQRKAQDEIGQHAERFPAYLREANQIISKAKADVEALIDGTLDEANLLAESREIDRWLQQNPSPQQIEIATPSANKRKAT